MSRMLEALRQIEARQQASLPVPESPRQDAEQADRPEDVASSCETAEQPSEEAVVAPEPPVAVEETVSLKPSVRNEEPATSEEPVLEDEPPQEEPPAEEAASTSIETPAQDEIPAPEDETTSPQEPVRDVTAMATTLAEAESAAASTCDASEEQPSDEFRVNRSRSRPSGQQASEYGDLADEILARTETEQPVSLLFTSPTDGAGTTEMLASLATALAERLPGEVLAVDGNVHRPALAARLGVEAMHGLGDVLSGTRSWRDVIRQTAVPDLSVLPGVRYPAGGTMLPGQINLKPLLAELAEQYRLVIVDSMSLTHLGAQSIARDCDGTYLVIRLRQTPRRAVQEAINAVDASGGRLLGCVVVDE